MYGAEARAFAMGNASPLWIELRTLSSRNASSSHW